MRKIFIIVVLFLLTLLAGCTNKNINSNVYISSIGFEINEGQLTTYFLSNPLTDISRSNEGKEDKKAEYIKVDANSVSDAFLKAEQSLLSPLNYLHIKTVIFNGDCFKTKYVEEFFQFMKSVLYVSYNFYVFATTEKISEIYEFKNPEQISYQYSILSSPNLLNFAEYGTEKLHFLDFANDFYDLNRYLHIPTIKINDLWGENKTLEVNGFLAVDNDVFFYNNTEYNGMLYLFNKEMFLIKFDDVIYRVFNYKVFEKEKEGVFTLVISYDDVYIFGDGSVNDFNEKLTYEISAFLNAYIKENKSLYLINFYNYLNKKALDVQKYDIEIL